jgi:hypothetical protein
MSVERANAGRKPALSQKQVRVTVTDSIGRAAWDQASFHTRAP